ncbi:hypothetical protein GCM10010282_44180 [Streptomyces roseolus]|nr:hypothetical protein GCM10010282_44180 [Streptomyces roseolus]
MSKRTESKRGGGTISATSRSAGTWGSREHSESGVAAAGAASFRARVDTVPHCKRRVRLRECDACFL